MVHVDASDWIISTFGGCGHGVSAGRYGGCSTREAADRLDRLARDDGQQHDVRGLVELERDPVASSVHIDDPRLECRRVANAVPFVRAEVRLGRSAMAGEDRREQQSPGLIEN